MVYLVLLTTSPYSSSAKAYCGLALWSGIVSSTTITYSQLACGTARTMVNNIYPRPTYSSTGIMPVQTSMAGVFGTIINPTTTATTTATSSSTSNAANGNFYGCGSSESNITSPSCFINAEIVTLKCWGGSLRPAPSGPMLCGSTGWRKDRHRDGGR